MARGSHDGGKEPSATASRWQYEDRTPTAQEHVIIGAGSGYSTRKLVADLISRNEAMALGLADTGWQEWRQVLRKPPQNLWLSFEEP